MLSHPWAFALATAYSYQSKSCLNLKVHWYRYSLGAFAYLSGPQPRPETNVSSETLCLLEKITQSVCIRVAYIHVLSHTVENTFLKGGDFIIISLRPLPSSL